MRARRIISVGIAVTLALVPCWASDNFTSNLQPTEIIIGHPDLMSVGDPSTGDATDPGTTANPPDPSSTDPNSTPPPDSPSDNTLVANAPNPNDPNYIQELKAQLQQQQAALAQAQATLAADQDQLVVAIQLQQAQNQYEREIQNVEEAAQQNAMNSFNAAFAREQALESFTRADQVLVKEAQQAVNQTQALLNAAQNGQPPPSQTSGGDSTNTDVSDAGTVTNNSIAGGGSAEGSVA